MRITILQLWVRGTKYPCEAIIGFVGKLSLGAKNSSRYHSTPDRHHEM